jgi:hypothetical protein
MNAALQILVVRAWTFMIVVRMETGVPGHVETPSRLTRRGVPSTQFKGVRGPFIRVHWCPFVVFNCTDTAEGGTSYECESVKRMIKFHFEFP